MPKNKPDKGLPVVPKNSVTKLHCAICEMVGIKYCGIHGKKPIPENTVTRLHGIAAQPEVVDESLFRILMVGVEFGFKEAERGNLEMAKDNAARVWAGRPAVK